MKDETKLYLLMPIYLGIYILLLPIVLILAAYEFIAGER